VLEKKPNYWYHGSDNIHLLALPGKIIFKLNRDDVSQQLEFKSQALDVSGVVTIKTLLDLKEDSGFNANYHAAVMPTYNYTYLAMNQRPDGITRQKLFEDVRVRKALAFVTPVDEMIRIVYKSYSPQCHRLAGPVSPLKKECDTTLALRPYDLEAARKLLDEAGWKDTDHDNVRDKMIDGKKSGP
jgi:ABC-type transport system substrate-binding protein